MAWLQLFPVLDPLDCRGLEAALRTDSHLGVLHQQPGQRCPPLTAKTGEAGDGAPPDPRISCRGLLSPRERLPPGRWHVCGPPPCVWHVIIYLPTCQPEDPGTRDASVQVGVTCEDKATQWEEREEADPSLDKPSGANTTVSSIDRQDRGGQGAEHPQTPGVPEEGGSSAPESGCHQDSGVSVAFRPVRHIIIFLPTCQPEEEDPGARDASVQVGVTCEDKATQWEEREEADPSLDKPSGANSTEAGMSGAFPSMHCRRIVVYLPTCLPEEDPGTRDASVQVGVTCEDKATQWEENVQADPSLDKSLGAFSKANSCPPGPTSSRQAVNNLLRTWGLPKGEKESPAGLTGGGDPLRDTSPGSRDASVQVGVTCEDKATQWEESVEADPSLDKPSGANSRVSSIDSQDGVGRAEHPQTPGAPAGRSSAPESSCHQEDGMSVAFRPVRHIVIFLPTCQPEDPGTRDASVQVGVTYEDKATQWEEREEADPSLDKPSGANTTVSSIDSQEAGMSGAFPSMHRRRIVVYLPTCQPEDPGIRDASVQVGVTYEDKATQWEEREEADPSLDKPSGANTTQRAQPGDQLPTGPNIIPPGRQQPAVVGPPDILLVSTSQNGKQPRPSKGEKAQECWLSVENVAQEALGPCAPPPLRGPPMTPEAVYCNCC
ncbi:UNVERIFIED_CONTAM: hypothetical protein K2H54_011946 [Gekko kuhli]